MIWSFLANPWITRWLRHRARRTPYSHITTADGENAYMNRWWLFNGYNRPRHISWLPSVRMHHILRPDEDRHLHDHPWNARTVILIGSYSEQREDGEFRLRKPGDTATLKFGEYHRISAVSPGGVWTLFITGRKRGTWGFLVDGAKVPHFTYLQKK